MIVVDSDILIDSLQGRPQIREAMTHALRAKPLATTVVNAFEMLSGARKGEERTRIRALLGPFRVLPLEEDACVVAAEVRRHLDSQGQGIGLADYLIAGVCLIHGASLWTRNVRHFGRVPGLRLEELGAR